MTIYTTSSSTTTQISALTSNDIWIVRPNVFVTVSSGSAIDATGSAEGRAFLIHGGLVAQSNGIYMAGTNSYVTLTDTGTIEANSFAISSTGGDLRLNNAGCVTSWGSVAIYASGEANKIMNSGQISSYYDSGVYLESDNNSLTNSGHIHSLGASGVYLSGSGNSILNSGEIVSDAVNSQRGAVRFVTSTDDANRLVNLGLLSGQVNAVLAQDGAETVINQGTINGHVILGAGNDIFDGRGGTVVGEVRGGVGDDLYWLDDPDLVLVENAAEGTDTVKANCSFELGANLEHLLLLGQAAHSGVGNNLANQITGNNANNSLSGLAGGDTLKGRGGDDVLRGGAGNDILIGGLGADVLDGGSGSDRAQYNDADEGLTADLDVATNNTGFAAGDTYLGIENLSGSGYGDTLRGDGVANQILGLGGNDLLQGRGGADRLTGGNGQDTLTGGAGADIFDFDALAESGNTPTSADLITDFAVGVDDIDLSGIDADSALAGDQAFTFIGTAAFSAAGQIRLSSSDGDTYVEANVDTTIGADFVLHLTGNISLSAADFIL
jgi:Ca2+-binding RTX toxin-like protein